jgi:hypothetical protein
MTAQPEPMLTQRSDDPHQVCADCGRPVDEVGATGLPFRLCRPCYEVTVDNAGR